MSFKLSTGLRNALMGTVSSLKATSLTADEDTEFYILESGDALLTLGFRPSDVLTISGFGTGANNQITTVIKVWADGSKLEVVGTLTDDTVGDDRKIEAAAKGFKQLFANNVIRVYSGTEPANADADEGAGELLLEISKASGVVVPGTPANGNNFDEIAAGVLTKDSEVWSDVGLATGTASWWRLYDNGIITGASTTAIRCQGTVGTSGVTFILSSTSITAGATTTLDTCTFTMPAS